jgi:hypothetical protein
VCTIDGIFKKMEEDGPVSFERPIRIRKASQEALHLNEDRVPVHVMKAYKGSRGIAPLILNFFYR